MGDDYSLMNKRSDNFRQEEIQDIIDRMPVHWSLRFAMVTGIFILVVFILSYIIKYPDTVSGEISITSHQAPIRLISNVTGRIHLLKTDKSMVVQGDVISYVVSGVDYLDMLRLDSLLQMYSLEYTKPLPSDLLLGDISVAYHSFVLANTQYRQFVASDSYDIMRKDLLHQLEVNQENIKNMDQNLSIKKEILDDVFAQLQKDSAVQSIGGMSIMEYQNKKSAYLTLKSSLLDLESSRLRIVAEMNKNRLGIQRIDLEERENREKVHIELLARKNELINHIAIWKERFLQEAPIQGELEYLGFWRDNSFIQAGQELFSVIPEKTDIIGEVLIPSMGAGKVEPGQDANIKVNNYPNDEFGMLKGKVQSVSRLTNKIQIQGRSADAYLVTILFPNGTTTNFGLQLALPVLCIFLGYPLKPL